MPFGNPGAICPGGTGEIHRSTASTLPPRRNPLLDGNPMTAAAHTRQLKGVVISPSDPPQFFPCRVNDIRAPPAATRGVHPAAPTRRVNGAYLRPKERDAFAPKARSVPARGIAPGTLPPLQGGGQPVDGFSQGGTLGWHAPRLRREGAKVPHSAHPISVGLASLRLASRARGIPREHRILRLTRMRRGRTWAIVVYPFRTRCCRDGEEFQKPLGPG